jgi:hypothetical protein
VVILPPQYVQAPEPRGIRYGLLAAANGPLDLPAPHGLAGGVVYEPVSCGPAHIWPNICHPLEVRLNEGFAATNSGTEKVFDGQDPWITAESFVVYATLQCGTAGHTYEQLAAKVLRRIANGEQVQAETALASTLSAGATPILNPGLSMADAVGELEEWLYGSAGADYGNIGYLHCSPRLAAYAAESRLVERNGPILQTRLGTVWIFGGGYPDDGTLYISGQATVWRAADIFVSPQVGALDKATNQYRLVAEREYAVAYDCVAASTTFNWGNVS